MTTRTSILLSAAALAALIAAPASAATLARATTPLNIRSGPGPLYAVTGSIAQNGDSDGCDIPEEEMSPIKVRSQSLAGAAFTYPAGRFLTFNIADARDPNLPPVEQVPRRQPAIGFSNKIFCTYTSSPANSYTSKIEAGTVNGTIE